MVTKVLVKCQDVWTTCIKCKTRLTSQLHFARQGRKMACICGGLAPDPLTATTSKAVVKSLTVADAINYSSKDANHMTVHVEYVGALGIDRYYVASHIANLEYVRLESIDTLLFIHASSIY